MNRPIIGRDRGQTLVEFALVLPVVLVTIFGILEYGVVVWQYNTIADLAQEGARWASVRGRAAGAAGVTESQVQTFVQNRALGLNPAVSTYTVDASTKTCTTTHVDPNTLGPGAGLCVVAQKSVAPLTRLVPLGTMTLSATAQMIVAR